MSLRASIVDNMLTVTDLTDLVGVNVQDIFQEFEDFQNVKANATSFPAITVGRSSGEQERNLNCELNFYNAFFTVNCYTQVNQKNMRARVASTREAERDLLREMDTLEAQVVAYFKALQQSLIDTYFVLNAHVTDIGDDEVFEEDNRKTMARALTVEVIYKEEAAQVTPITLGAIFWQDYTYEPFYDKIIAGGSYNEVAGWIDSSESGNNSGQVVAGRRPLYIPGLAAGQSTVLGDGVDDSLYIDGVSPIQPNLSMTVVVVVNKTNSNSQNFMGLDSSFKFGTQGNKIRFTTLGVADYDTTNDEIIPGTKQCISAVFDATTRDVSFYVDGQFVETVSGSLLGNTSNSSLQLFAQSAGFLDGNVSAMIGFQKALNAQENLDLHNYLVGA